MAENIESKLGKVPSSVDKQFQEDCDRIVKLKARKAKGPLKEKYSRWGIPSDKMWYNMLGEMGFSEEERRIIMDCERYHDLLKSKPLVVREMLISNLDRKYKDSTVYASYRVELREELGLLEGEKK
jgi:hypothetical protein